MKKQKVTNYIVYSISSLGLIFSLYLLLFARSGVIPEYKAFLLFVSISIVCFLWLIGNFTNILLLSLRKTSGMEKILLDIRDGTKKFYVERRKSPRIMLKDQFSAKLITKDISGLFVKVMDISREGARLQVIKELKPGDTIDLDMYLPLFPDPVYVKAKIVRTNKAESFLNQEKYSTSHNAGFDVGVEYIDMGRRDIDKISETISLLHSTSSRFPS